MNRTSLRQAIARLEQMGLLEARQGRGTVVRPVEHATDPALVAHLVARDRRRVLAELFEVRGALAPLVGRAAAAHGTAAQRHELRSLLARVAACGTAADRQDAELAAFRHLVAMGRNRPLVAMQRWVDAAYGDAAALFVGAFDDAEPVVAGLTAVVEAVDAGDAAAAGASMAEYATESARRLLAAVDRSTRRARSSS